MSEARFYARSDLLTSIFAGIKQAGTSNNDNMKSSACASIHQTALQPFLQSQSNNYPSNIEEIKDTSQQDERGTTQSIIPTAQHYALDEPSL